MTTPLLNMLQAQAISVSIFPPDSRYFNFTTQTYTGSDGRTVSYLTRRFVPQPASFTVLTQIQVKQGDRLDMIASNYMADPLMYWQICDANGAVDPDDLVATPGSSINITMPGVPGATNA